MRLAALVFGMLMICGLAEAQTWREYAYPGYAFALSFPAPPKTDTRTYAAADGTSVPAQVYFLEQDDVRYEMMVADLAKTRIGEKEAVDHAVRQLAEQGQVTVDIGHRINRVYGRQLGIANSAGGHSSAAVFYYQKRLYQIVGTVLPSHPDPSSGDAIRFQQSLRFTNRAWPLFGLDTLFGAFGPFGTAPRRTAAGP